jgi:hypothetical protein
LPLQFTFEARLQIDAALDALLAENAAHWSWGLRKAWSLLSRQKLTEAQAYAELGKHGFTSHQVGSLLIAAQGKYKALVALKKTELQQLELSVDQRERALAAKRKKITSLQKRAAKLKLKREAWAPRPGKPRSGRYLEVLRKLRDIEADLRFCLNWVKQKESVLRDKRGKAARLKADLAAGRVKMCFGSKKLLAQRPTAANAATTPFASLDAWRIAWDAARGGQWWSVGEAKKPQGNAEVQWSPESGQLRIRLTDKLAHRRMDERGVPHAGTQQKFMPMRMQCRFVTIEGVDFVSHRGAARKALAAALGQQPVTMRVLYRPQPDGSRAWYVQASVDVPSGFDAVRPVTRESGVLGLDLNACGVAWCAVKPDGNRLAGQHGFIAWNLQGLSAAERKQALGTTVAQLVRHARRLSMAVAIESLDFTVRKAVLRANSVNQRYNEMLSSMPTAQFEELMARACERQHLTLYSVNPSYSSVGGFTKYGCANRLDADVSAAWWLARQALYGSAWKTEGVRSYVRKTDERLVFPLMASRMQSMKASEGLKWRDVARGLGKNRRLWGERLKQLLCPVEATSGSQEQPALALPTAG